MTEITELQKRRAENIIWNCAGSYEFTPDFKAYDKDGLADLYWNCIIGAVRKHYDYSLLEPVLRSFSQYDEDADTYEGLFWIGLENCTYQHELADRPVLAKLRSDYARESVEALKYADDYRLLECISLGHWQRAAGLPVSIPKYDTALLDELEFSPELTTEEIVERAKKLFEKWFQIVAEEKKQTKRKMIFPGFARHGNRKAKTRYRKFGIGIADHPDNIYGGANADGQDEREIKTSLTATELREFMETKYGRSMYTPTRTAELEKQLCSGSHELCHLLFTAGDRVDASQIQNGFEALSRQREAAQIEKNRKFFSDNYMQNHLQIIKLADNIRNSVLMYLEPNPVKTNAGLLNGQLVWRAVKLHDERVFTKLENDNLGNLCVDILLDSSTSQKERTDIISSQAYIIAESLTSCHIPCRVMSFCSMTGYTVLRVFREYNRPADNKRIFEYVSNGCNRDGLAIRAAHTLINESGYDHKLLIILSDVKPNDVVKIHSSGEQEFIPYEKTAGLTDTAFEVRRAHADGISVICIFTGDDEDLPAAKMVYGQDFVRIRSFDKLADTVGMLIRNRIKNL